MTTILQQLVGDRILEFWHYQAVCEYPRETQGTISTLAFRVQYLQGRLAHVQPPMQVEEDLGLNIVKGDFLGYPLQ